MEYITQFLHHILTAEGLRELIVKGGYIVLFLIVFAETGLLAGFFLPGDSLLVTTGLLIATGVIELNIWILISLLIVAAILGDATGFMIGRKLGERIYKRNDTRFFKKEHLERTHAFYEKHGGKTIIFARFIPVVRTFAPVVAGAAAMEYKKFAVYNIIGGVLWIVSTTMLGYLLAHAMPNIGDYLHYVIGIVILLSLLPPIIEWLKHRRRSAVSTAAGKQ